MKNLKNLSKTLLNKIEESASIGILGFGTEGISSLKFIEKYFTNKTICIADKNVQIREHKLLKNNKYKLFLGNEWINIFQNTTFIIVSPGVPLFGVEIPKEVMISSQTDIILSCFGHKIIGISGTKGKSTSSSLLQYLLKTVYDNVPLAGNIGIPPLDVFEQVAESQYAVFEISSHQLQHIKTSPHIALMLNIYEEHLDYYPDYDTYAKTKLKIYEFQNENDIAIVNNDIESLNNFEVQYKSQKFTYSLNKQNSNAYIDDNQIFISKENISQAIISTNEISLKGTHNHSNCLAIALIANIIGINSNIIKNALSTFKSLPHRLEPITCKNGKFFYNDSISTIPESTIHAVKSLSPIQTLIVGGMNRHINYDNFCEELVNLQVENIILYGEVGHLILNILDKLNAKINYIYKKDFSECVHLAIDLTSVGQICLLSPAASSYDQFQNFEKRGEKFKEIILSHC